MSTAELVDPTWPNAGVEEAPKAGVVVAPKAGVEPKPKPPWAGDEALPKSEGVDAAPNAGDDAAPNAGVGAWPKAALPCGCPNSPPEGWPKLPPGGAVPVFPLQPACHHTFLSVHTSNILIANNDRTTRTTPFSFDATQCSMVQRVVWEGAVPGSLPSAALHGILSCKLAWR